MLELGRSVVSSPARGVEPVAPSGNGSVLPMRFWNEWQQAIAGRHVAPRGKEAKPQAVESPLLRAAVQDKLLRSPRFDDERDDSGSANPGATDGSALMPRLISLSASSEALSQPAMLAATPSLTQTSLSRQLALTPETTISIADTSWTVQLPDDGHGQPWSLQATSPAQALRVDADAAMPSWALELRMTPALPPSAAQQVAGTESIARFAPELAARFASRSMAVDRVQVRWSSPDASAHEDATDEAPDHPDAVRPRSRR